MGGGTTGTAALKLGRRFIGVEIDRQAFATGEGADWLDQ
jgi:DNA modification methylase